MTVEERYPWAEGQKSASQASRRSCPFYDQPYEQSPAHLGLSVATTSCQKAFPSSILPRLAGASVSGPFQPPAASPAFSISREAGFILGLIYETRPGINSNAVAGLIY